MSNWIANKITAKNINNLHIYDENGLVDFNKIIPEPTEKNNALLNTDMIYILQILYRQMPKSHGLTGITGDMNTGVLQ